MEASHTGTGSGLGEVGANMPKKQRVERMSALLRLPDGPVDLTAHDPSATPGAPGDKEVTRAAMGPLGSRLAHLQELLYANGRGGGGRQDPSPA